jgi:hypothetical protein
VTDGAKHTEEVEPEQTVAEQFDQRVASHTMPVFDLKNLQRYR